MNDYLDQLIESKSGERENKTRGGYLLTIGALIAGLCFSSVLYSLFAKDFSAGAREIELSALVAPIADAAPAATIEKREKLTADNKINNVPPSRRANILQIEETPIAIPNHVSVVPNSQKSRPNGNFLVSDRMETEGSPNAHFGKSIGGNDAGGIKTIDDGESNGAKAKVVEPPPLPPARKPVEEKTQKPKIQTVSGGVVNGKAQRLPKPIYTAAAKSLRLSGEVTVQVLIDEKGTVVSAKAVSGHPLLRNEAEKAARDAKFEPTLLTGQPVKVSGVIVYKFSMQ